jgi:hypothetical protein
VGEDNLGICNPPHMPVRLKPPYAASLKYSNRNEFVSYDTQERNDGLAASEGRGS